MSWYIKSYTDCDKRASHDAVWGPKRQCRNGQGTSQNPYACSELAGIGTFCHADCALCSADRPLQTYIHRTESERKARTLLILP
eukprot:s19_g21.t1